MTTDMELHATASLLRRGSALDQLSTGLSLLGALLGLSQYGVTSPGAWGLTCCALLLVLGLWQKYWALRVAFDADLFQRIAEDAQALAQRTRALDQALTTLGLQSAERDARPWSDRTRGALNLLRRQALLVALQVLVTLGFILAGPWLSLAK